jgi:hypothetical protein
VDPQTFATCDPIVRPAVIVAVARAGAVRLLDNVSIPSAAGVDPIVTPVHELPRGVRTRST